MKIVLGVVLGIVALSSAASANHSWGKYHWARTSNPFTVKLGDNVSTTWDSHLVTTSKDWTESSVLNTTIVNGQAGSNCSPTAGRVEVCNAEYGDNNWLGIAQIWTTKGTHIAQGLVKLNDTYFKTAPYNKSEWRNLVMCQEVGHTFGLGHQDETFDNPNLGSCMDYTSDPLGPLNNEQPNAHDYAQLEKIYAHLDRTTTVGQTTSNMPPGLSQIDLDRPQGWGREVWRSINGRVSVYLLDFRGHHVMTYVFWTHPED